MRSRVALFLSVVLLALLLAAVAGAARAGALAFLPAASYPTDQWPRAVAVGDFNNDGKQDLVTANLSNGTGTVSVLLGDGHGGFGAKTDLAVGIDPESVAVGDFNHDGKLDVVTANWLASTVSVLLGKGDGSFAAKHDFVTGTHPASVAVADFNRDGKQDVVTANEGASSVSVLLGKGDGSFFAKTDFATSVGSFPHSLVVADLISDGRPDVVTANTYAPTVSVLLCTDAGGFRAPTDYATGEGPSSVAIADFNNDGNKDLVTANYNSTGSVSVLLGDPNGRFGTHTDFAAGPYPLSVAVGDLDRDGKQDLVVAGDHATTVSVLLGLGNGSFAAKSDVAAGATPHFVAVSDLNGDGKLDLVTGSSSGDSIRVLLQAPVKPTLGKPSCPKSVTHGKQFKVYGTLSPHFAPYAKTVKVKAYRYASGKWKLYKTYAAINTDSGSHTKYTAKVTLTKRGKYRFKAFTAATAQFLAAKTGFSRTLTVK